MKLIYRGVGYNEANSYLATSLVEARKREIIYRGNSPIGQINPKFPYLSYFKQLFLRSKVKLVGDPITFWYNHKRKFLQDCWHLDEIEKLELAWDLTLKIERDRQLKPKQQIKLKYRGVTYYR